MAQKSTPTDATRPPVDDVLGDIAEYVLDYQVSSSVAEKTARLALMDALGCAFYSLGNPQCTRVLGPLVPGATLDGGALRTYRHAPNTGSRKSWARPAAACVAGADVMVAIALLKGACEDLPSMPVDEFVSRLVI